MMSFIRVFLVILLLPSFAYAGNQHDHGHQHRNAHKHKQHGAHVQGGVELQISIEDHTMAITLRSPAANLMGSEHKPEIPAQSIQDVVAVLNAPTDLFELSKETACTASEVEVDAPRMHDSHYGTDQQTEFIARYYYNCPNADALRQIQVNLIAQFPSIERVEVQLTRLVRQRQYVLTSDNSQIDL